MTKADGSILSGPAQNEPVATLTIDGKEHQVVLVANSDGHVLGSIPTYQAWSGVIAAAANKVYMHIFNAAGSGKIVKVRKMFVQPSMAVNALAAQTWRLSRTNAVGTTGTVAITIRAHDETGSPAVPAQVTAAHSFTAGGTDLYTYFEIPISVEETLPAVGIVPWFNVLPVDGDFVQDYVLREGQGLKLINVTGGAYSYSVLAILSIE